MSTSVECGLELPALPEYLFGDRQLHARFTLAIELLARLVIANPRPISTAVLADSLGQPTRTVRTLLSSLHQSGLLVQNGKDRDAWTCPAELGSITLADVFRSVVGEMQESTLRRKKNGAASPSEESRSAAQQSVDLLLMQATMAINQVVLQHLQTFDLGRLKALESGNGFYAFHSRARSYVAEPIIL